VVDNKTFTNNGATTYKPNNTGGVIRCSRCRRRRGPQLIWFTSDGPAGPQIPACDDKDMPVPCSKTVGNSIIDLDLMFLTFSPGTYKCGGSVRQFIINIKTFG